MPRSALLLLVLTLPACGRKVEPTPTSPPEPPVVVTGADLSTAYKANAVGADQKYKGKMLEITGKVGSVAKDILNRPFVSLDTGSAEDVFGISCYFGESELTAAGQLQPGQDLKVRGRCTGQTGGTAITLKDCTFIK